MVPEMMTAIAVEGDHGPAEALKPVQIGTPRPGPGQILIEMSAAGVNRPDLLQRQGLYPPPPGAPEILGLEMSGHVAALGPGVDRWRVGEGVTALLGGGGYAQYAVVDAYHALPIPTGLDLLQAAALPETAFTVYANLFEHGALQAGETLLLHGATSGIGVMAIQMAKAAGARVIATGRGAAKAQAALALGADIAIDASAQDFVAETQAAGGADVVLDMVGGDYIPRGLAALRRRGRLVVIAVQAGARCEINLVTLMQKQAVLTGSTLRPRSADEKARLAAAVEARVWPWIAEGRVRPVIDRTFPLNEAAQAHAWLEAGGHVGKVMLTA